MGAYRILSSYRVSPKSRQQLRTFDGSFHISSYAGGATWTPAWKLHQDDPTEMLRRQIKKKFKNTKLRALYMSRCHIYPEEVRPVRSGQKAVIDLFDSYGMK